MYCGIHQGCFLSLTKYIAFINDMIVQLKSSNLCCSMQGINSSPEGYADDLAAATVSKSRTDHVHQLVYKYGCRWHFSYNA